MVINGSEKTIDAVLVKGGSRMLVRLLFSPHASDCVSDSCRSEHGSGNLTATKRDTYPGHMRTPSNTCVHPAQLVS